MYEYRQSMDEGLDVENLKDVFEAVSKMKRTEHKEAICDTLFNIVCESKTREDFKYNEPSSLELQQKTSAHALVFVTLF